MDNGSFERNLNVNFLLLIPNKSGVVDLKDFESIRLVGGLYKLLTKVLTYRLKNVVGKVVSAYEWCLYEG